MTTTKTPYDFKMWTASGQVEVVTSDYDTFPALQFANRLIGVQVACADGMFVTYDQPIAGMCGADWEWIDSIERRWAIWNMKVIKIGVHPVTMAELHNIAFFDGRIKEP